MPRNSNSNHRVVESREKGGSLALAKARVRRRTALSSQTASVDGWNSPECAPANRGKDGPAEPGKGSIAPRWASHPDRTTSADDTVGRTNSTRNASNARRSNTLWFEHLLRDCDIERIRWFC
jgi:hypothetical protein